MTQRELDVLDKVAWSTKAETLERLGPKLKTAQILGQVRLTAGEWQRNSTSCIRRLQQQPWAEGSLIVRSSAAEEDTKTSSLAGRYHTKQNVKGWEALNEAISEVVRSFDGISDADQIFIQPFLQDIALSGVVFSRDPNTGGPYIVINYDDHSGSTDTVTSGKTNNTKIFYLHRESPVKPSKKFAPVIALVRELETLLSCDAVDAEFAVTLDGRLYLFQVRPLVMLSQSCDQPLHRRQLSQIYDKITESSKPHPYLHGSKTVYGVMPDWNPAEIIGIRPRPLALSLYKELITDSVWAYQRDNYGYRNLRSFPLMVSFEGLPYIDVRVSFNSFIPAELEPELARRLVDYYIARLVENPHHHDKVEFDIIFSCYTLDLPKRLEGLKSHGFSAVDIEKFSQSLHALTQRIIHRKHGLWRNDLEKIGLLEERRSVILNSTMDTVSKIYWLIEDCKRYGTLPFAGLARAAFIAVQLLQSLVSAGVLDPLDYENFMGSLETMGSRITQDFRSLSKEEFLKQYGHLRPGTYDILAPRYDEEPDRYFDWNEPSISSVRKPEFFLSPRILQATNAILQKHGFDCDAEDLFYFIKQAIEGREYAKFIFSHSVSDALSLFKQLAAEHGLSADEASYVDVSCIAKRYASSSDVGAQMRENARQGRDRYALTRAIELPPLITEVSQVWAFELPVCQPNFITQRTAEGSVVFSTDEKSKLKGNILMLPSADPGFDWIFAQGIVGFITMYGGVNSHMAVRAGELGVPAVIGAGEVLYAQWARAKRLYMDCTAKQVRVLK